MLPLVSRATGILVRIPPAFTLIPQIVDSVKIPVIAGGGYSDGRQMVAALFLGAEGVY